MVYQYVQIIQSIISGAYCLRYHEFKMIVVPYPYIRGL
jgi:hypothetical protein